MGFTKEDVEGLSKVLGEPGWVLDRRLSAWSAAESLEIPREKDSENWRYTDLYRMKFDFEPFTLARPATSTDITGEAEALVAEEGDRAGYLIQRDADVVMTQLDPSAAKSGVIVTDLRSAALEYGDLLKEYLLNEISSSENKFTALHGALFSGGTFIYVPRGVTVELPIESQRWIDVSSQAVFPHTLIVVEEGAELTYIERYRSSDLTSPSLSVGGFELLCGQGSRVTFASLQEFGDNVWHFQKQRGISAGDVTLRSLVVTLGGKFSRVETESVIRGRGSTSEMLGLYFAEQTQHFDHRTLQDHVDGGSISDLLYKGALKHHSRAVYSGLIRVHEGADKTDAYQMNRNLVLSDEAKADSKPELEIMNNDLRCTHGASVSQIDDQELFYLQTRGLPAPDAERLIVDGFFEEVVGRVRIEEVRSVLREAIERKLGS